MSTEIVVRMIDTDKSQRELATELTKILKEVAPEVKTRKPEAIFPTHPADPAPSLENHGLFSVQLKLKECSEELLTAIQAHPAVGLAYRPPRRRLFGMKG